jgi:uncharacterized protein YjiS (DUF1127 family)
MDWPHFKEESMTTQIVTSASFAAPAQTFMPREARATSNPFRFQRISQWWRRIRERRELTTLSHRELADFMCNKADVAAETGKWFWEA